MPARAVAVVPHTHWDREWYLPFQTFRLRLVDLLDGLLADLEAHPGSTHFLLDGQLAVVDDHLAVRPGDADRLRRLITQGRIAVGPWYTLPDEFLVSGETLVRDLQLGFETAAPLGGAMAVGYLPDMFGHVAQMPQLLRRFGIAHAVVWRGVPAAIDRSAFRWVAPDGSEVRAEYLVAGYGNGARVPGDAQGLVKQVDEFAEHHRALVGDGPVLWMNGTDHLLPQPWLPAVVAVAGAIQDRWAFTIAGLSDYLERVAPPLDAGSPTWCGELRSGARANLLMGVTSNRVDVRQAAARAERALERLAEPASALFLPADRWPDRLLAEAWLEVIRNAAHDSVCACSHDEVVAAVLHRYAQARQIGEGLAERAVAALGASVDHEGPVVVNLSSRTRSGLVELVVPHTGEPPGAQTVEITPADADLATLASPALAAGFVAELEYVHQYTAAAIVDAADGVVLFDSRRDGTGRLVGPTDRVRLERLMMEERGPRPVRVPVRQRPSRTILTRVTDVPGYGWQGWPAGGAASPARGAGAAGGADAVLPPVTAAPDGRSLGNQLVSVGPAAFRLVDGGDVGDTYNWCPPDDDAPVVLATTRVEVVETGPLRGRLRIEHSADDLDVSHRLELRAGERLVRVTTTIDNRRRNHRLRLHLPLPAPADHSEAECAFAVVTRGLTAEGGPTEVGVPTFPSRRFVRAGGLTVVHEGLPEYELVDIGADGRATAIAITLLRATGMLSQGPMATRPLPAGPRQPLEGPQLQRAITVRWGFVHHPAASAGDEDGDVAAEEGDAAPEDGYALVEEAFLPLLVAAGRRGAGRPAEGTALAVAGAEVSAVRRTPTGQLEVRVFNPTGKAVTCALPERRGWVVDLRGHPLHQWTAGVELRPWEIATLVLD